MMTTRWFLNSFHVQILLLELVLCFHLPRRSHFYLRLLLLSLVYLALPYLIPGGYFSNYLLFRGFPIIFILMFLLSALLLWFLFSLSIERLIFYCCVAHTLQHITHCGAEIVYLILGPRYYQPAEVLLFALALFIGWHLIHSRMGPEEALEGNIRILVFAVTTTLIIYFLSYFTTYYEGETVGGEFFDLFSCSLMTMLLFDSFRLRKAQEDHLTMLQMLRKEQELSKLSKATVEVINRKCHDLKYQISALRNMSDEEQEESIAKLEEAVLIYEHFPKSGNADLDLILAEKSLLAEKRHVSLQYMVDGENLSFLQTEDLYSLLGNALDNAIEATSREALPEKRTVTLRLFTQGSFLYLHLDNPCSERPLFVGGLPKTTASDETYHGFGMKSMRFLAEKYGGALTTDWEEGIFSLDVVFPLPEKYKAEA